MSCYPLRIWKNTTRTLSLTLKRRQKGCLALTRRESIKKSQSAALKRGLKQTRRKRRRGQRAAGQPGTVNGVPEPETEKANVEVRVL